MEYKVVGYIEHRTRSGLLAAFVHAEDDAPLLDSGLQVLAGTVEPGESEVDVVLREAYEESGLVDLRVERRLGVDTVEWPARRALPIPGSIPSRRSVATPLRGSA